MKETRAKNRPKEVNLLLSGDGQAAVGSFVSPFLFFVRWLILSLDVPLFLVRRLFVPSSIFDQGRGL